MRTRTHRRGRWSAASGGDHVMRSGWDGEEAYRKAVGADAALGRSLRG